MSAPGSTINDSHIQLDEKKPECQFGNLNSPMIADLNMKNNYSCDGPCDYS